MYRKVFWSRPASILFLLICVYGCNPSISRIGYEITEKASPERGEIPIVKTKSDSLFAGKIVGKIEIGDNCFSANCDAGSVETILLAEAELAGANLIQVKEVDKPDFWSNCYRVKANFIKIEEKDTNYKTEIAENLYSLINEEKYYQGELLDTLETPKPDLKIGIGYELSQPSVALNSFLYYKGLMVRYAYGFAGETSKPDKMIKDIKNSHSISLAYEVGAMWNKICYLPIYLGVRKSFVNEAKDVQGFKGNGSIDGMQYFIGINFLSSRNNFFKHFGGFVEIGKADWNYDKSILVKNNTGLKYNYSNFYFTMGLLFYIK